MSTSTWVNTKFFFSMGTFIEQDKLTISKCHHLDYFCGGFRVIYRYCVILFLFGIMWSTWLLKKLFNGYSHWAGKTYHIEISPSSCFRGFLWCILLFYFCLISRDILRCVVPINDFFLSTMLTNNGWWYFVHFRHHKTFLAVRFYIFFIDVCFRRYLFMSSIFYFSSFVDFCIPSKLF